MPSDRIPASEITPPEAVFQPPLAPQGGGCGGQSGGDRSGLPTAEPDGRRRRSQRRPSGAPRSRRRRQRMSQRRYVPKKQCRRLSKSATITTSTNSPPKRRVLPRRQPVSYPGRGQSPWPVWSIKPKTFDIDEIRRLGPLEERVYRMRCVEAWSMVIPWVGFPLARLLDQRGAAGQCEVRRVRDPARPDPDARSEEARAALAVHGGTANR